MSSGGDGISAAMVTLRAVRADASSPATSHASATNEAPAAMPPNQKYSGTSQVHTGAGIIGPWTAAGMGPPRPRRLAAATRAGSAPASERYAVPRWKMFAHAASSHAGREIATGAPATARRQDAGPPPDPTAAVVSRSTLTGVPSSASPRPLPLPP